MLFPVLLVKNSDLKLAVMVTAWLGTVKVLLAELVSVNSPPLFTDHPENIKSVAGTAFSVILSPARNLS